MFADSILKSVTPKINLFEKAPYVHFVHSAKMIPTTKCQQIKIQINCQIGYSHNATENE